MASSLGGYAATSSPASMPSISSPEDAAAKRQNEIERKRARDRKSQQAMRDRAKWTMHNLSEQVSSLTRSLAEQTQHSAVLKSRLQQLESENEHLRVQNAALRLSLLGDGTGKRSIGGGSVNIPVWAIPPNNTPPGNLADTILQGFVNSRRSRRTNSIGSSNAPSPCSDGQGSSHMLKPDLRALVYKDTSADDEISNVVVDIVKSYTEINSIPNQVAVAWSMVALLRWQVMLDESSWNAMPQWLRPTQTQLTTPHAAWIDRMPWPRVRDWLIEHPTITLDHLAAVYSSSFFIQWDYDPSHVLIASETPSKVVITNPIYEEHIRQLKYWNMGPSFCKVFPQLAELAEQAISPND